MELSPATQGNTVLDISSSQDTIVTSGETPTVISRGIWGLLPQGTVGLLSGRSVLNSRGVQIHTGVIASDYEGELKVMVSTALPWKVSKGNRLAQLLILSYVGIGHSDKEQSSGAFGGTGEAGIFLTENILESRAM